VTGWSMGSGSNFDYVTLKYNSSGALQWVQRYNGPVNNDDRAYAITTDNSGNVYVTGTSVGNYNNRDFVTIKYNSSGSEQWVQSYNGTGNGEDWAYSIAVDASGNVYVTGYSMGSGSNLDYATVKYNSAGVQQWVQRYNGTGNGIDRPLSLTVDQHSNIYVTGSSFDSGTLNDYATIKYNSSGIQQWVSIYNGPSNGDDVGYSVRVDLSGNVYVTGASVDNLSGRDYATLKYNSSGIQQWVARYNGPGNADDYSYYVAVDNSGVYITGRSFGSGTNYDYATVKYNLSGVQQWVQRYSGPAGNGSDESFCVVIDSYGNVYVTGASRGSGSLDDFATIKYSQTTGIRYIAADLPSEFSLYQNYPNPFNPTTIIRFDISKYSFTRLSLYDLTGNEIDILVNEYLLPGKYQIEWDGSNYSSGIYFCRLSSGDYVNTIKITLIR